MNEAISFIKNRKKEISITIWIAFAIFLVFQHRAIFIHYDDFGYASLSYGNNLNSHGMDWNFMDLIKFLKWHYLNWGGRILTYAVLVVVLKLGESAIQIFQAFIIWGICFLTYKCCCEKTNLCGALLSIGLYCSIGIMLIRETAFWYAASAGYVWPMLPFLLAFYFLKSNENVNSKCNIVRCSILFFLAGFSQEQYAVAVIVFLLYWFIFNRISKSQYFMGEIIILLSGCFGALLEILAPGNFVRKGNNSEFYSLDIIAKIRQNLSVILNVNFGEEQWTWLLVYITCLIIVGIMLKKWYIQLINIILILCILYSTFVEGVVWTPIIRTLFVIISMIEMLFAVVAKKGYLMVGIIIASFCTQAMMVYAPFVGRRTAGPFQLLMHIVMLYIFVSHDSTTIFKKIIYCLLIAACFINCAYITKGYYSNKTINEINRSKLCEKSLLLDAGKSVPSLVLYKLVDDKFAITMPYRTSFIEAWLKKYYELPQSTIIIWQDIDEIGNSYETVVSNKPSILSVQPQYIADTTSRNDDGSVTITVTPEVMDRNLKVLVNGEQIENVMDITTISALVPKSFLNNDLIITLYDEGREMTSDEVLYHVEK